MSSGADDRDSREADRPTMALAPVGTTAPAAGEHPQHPQDHHHHHILIEPEEDRWRWRRKIRQDRRKLVVYRAAVGILGLILIALGVVSGPLPGPGGIPLVLLGLAVWSSEFEWAHQVMMGLKKELHRYRTWSVSRKTLFWVAFFSCCGLLGYAYMLTLGIPGWLPGSAHQLLQRLPGL